MRIWNIWHTLSRFNTLYVVSTYEGIPKLIEEKNVGYYGKRTVKFMCIKDGALYCYY